MTENLRVEKRTDNSLMGKATQYIQKTKANNTRLHTKIAWITLQRLCFLSVKIKWIVTRLCVLNCETYKQLTSYFTISQQNFPVGF